MLINKLSPISVTPVKAHSEYFNIGQKNMRRIAEDHFDSFALMHGNRILIIRSRCEEYIISCLKTEEGGKSL